MARVADTFPVAGVLADRPVDPGSVPAFYSATDTNLIYRWDGVTWETWASGATDPEVVRDAIGTALVAGENVTIAVDDAGDTITISGAASGLWKGPWVSAPDEVVWTQDFGTDLTPFTGEGVRTAMADAGGSAKPSGYGWVDQGSGTADHGSVHNIASLTLSDIPELAGRTPTRIKFWQGLQAQGAAAIYRNNIFEVLRNGAVQFTDSIDTNGNLVQRPWAELDISASTLTDTLLWRMRDGINTSSFYPTGTLAITGLRAYAAVVGWTGYKVDETVTYLGRLWRSTISDNMTTPGTAGASWAEVPLTPDSEAIRDVMGTALVAGTNVTIVVNDAGDTITISATDTNTTDPEVVRDTIGTALVAGANVTITPDDAGNTITIAASAGGGGTVDAMAFKDLWAAGTYDKGAVVIQDNLLFVAKQAGVTSTPARPLNNYAQDFSSKPTESYWVYGTSAGNTITSAPASAFAGATTSASMLKIYGGGTNTSNPSAQVTLDFPTGGTITFKDAVSSETNDYCRFFIDDVQQYVFSGTVGWTARTFTVAAGTHTLKWRYDKDSATSAGLDAYGITDLLCSGSVIGNTTDWGVLGWTDTGAEEAARDVLGKALVAGTNVTITPDDTGDTITIAAAAGGSGGSGLWKGAWKAAADELVYEKQFDTVAPFTGAGVSTPMANAYGTGKPPFAYADQGFFSQVAGGLVAGLTFADVPALAGKTITRAKFWVALYGNNTAYKSTTWTGSAVSNGVTKWSQSISKNNASGSTTSAWVEVEVNNLTTNLLLNMSNPGSFCEAGMAVADVRLYAATPGYTGYNAGEYVTYGGRVWTSSVSGNLGTPGIDVTWIEVPPDPEAIRDTIGTALVAGANVTITVNDAGDTITIASANTTDPEVVRDTIGTALVAGTNVSVGVDDAGDKITVSSTTRALNTQTANYTLVLADAGKFVRMNVATANTLTVPPNSAVAFPVGTFIEGVQTGAGQTTITPGAGVTINATPGLKTAAQYGTFGLLKVDTDTWLAYGRLSA